MFFSPHKLYKQESLPTELDENNDPIPGSGGDIWVYLCDCFLHDVTTQMLKGFTGIGITPSYYINLDRRDDLLETDRVKVIDKKDEKLIMGEGNIVRIGRTSGMSNNYTIIYI